MTIETVKKAKHIKLTWMNQNTGFYEKNNVNLWIRTDIRLPSSYKGMTDEQFFDLIQSPEYSAEILPPVEFDNDKWSN